ncbi:MAG: hypothetical protein ACP5JJ_13685, partial [Anaerolineae bacterium]
MTDQLQRDIEELAARIEQLKQKVRREQQPSTMPMAPWPAALEKAVERSWINPHQPIAWPEWPKGLWPKLIAVLQKITRRLLRWYIDPLIEQQNAFNAAVVHSLEQLHWESNSVRLQLEWADQGSQDVPAPSRQLPAINHQTCLQRRLRLAFFTPLSPLRTAIADHSEGLLPHLADLADVDLYIDDGYEPTNPEILRLFDVYSYRKFAVREYDAVLYAIGDNSDFHSYIHDMLQHVPGVVILHDTTLHRFTIGRTLQYGNTEGYLDEMEYAYGLRDLRIAEQVLAGYGDILTHRYPLIERVVDLAQGVIVHNEYARQQVLQRRPDAQVAYIGQHFFLPPGFPESVDLTALRAEMGLTDRFVVSSFGIFVPDKRLDSCLRAFARLAATHPAATYLFVGNYLDYDLPGRVRELGLEDRVIVTGWLDPIQFTKLMLVADVGVHLR